MHLIAADKDNPISWRMTAEEVTTYAVADDQGDRVHIKVMAFDYRCKTQHGMAISPKAFAASLDTRAKQKQAIPMLLNHNSNQMLGAFNAWENKGKLTVTGYIDKRFAYAGEAIAGIESGCLCSASIGFLAHSVEYDQRQNADVVTNGYLTEISLVPAGMQQEARVLTACGDIRRALPAGIYLGAGAPPTDDPALSTAQTDANADLLLAALNNLSTSLKGALQ